MNEADKVLSSVVLGGGAEGQTVQRAPDMGVVSATRGDHVDGAVETHPRARHSAFVSAELPSCPHTICYSRFFA